MNTFPSGMGPARRWKAQKRRELREIEAAFDVFRFGCAYTPMYPDGLEAMAKLIKAWQERCSIKEWGR